MLQYYPFFWGDYIQKTAHLSQSQHGAFMLFLRHIYGTGKPIEDRQKYRIAMAFTDEEKEAADYVLKNFFKESVNDGLKVWHNEKCEKVIKDANEKHLTNSKRAKDAANSRWAKKEEEELKNNAPSIPSSITSSNPSSNAQEMLGKCQPKTQNPNPERINLKTLSQTLSQVSKPEIPEDLKAEIGNFQPLGNFLGFPKQGFDGKEFGVGKGAGKKFTEAEQEGISQAANSFLNNLSKSARERAKKNAPGWCLIHLAGVYILGIPQRGKPEKGYNAAFPGWCLNYTKGNPPG